MKLSTITKSIILDSIVLLYILLFVYAAINKLMDFENFQIQLAQSPLLSAYAGWISYLVPLAEFFTVGLLLIPKFRNVALFMALSIMVMFTTYIIIILNFSPFVPCSCGGVLEKLGWHEHLIFNFTFVFLAIAGISIVNKEPDDNDFTRKVLRFPFVFLNLFCSISIVLVLFLLSEDTMHHHNNFIRRFPQHSTELIHERNLQSDAYYIAGVAEGKIFLGHYGAPLSITIIDTSLQVQQVNLIKLSRTDFPFRSLKIMVRAPYFYVSDGSVPCIFRGLTKDWKAQLWMQNKVFFSRIEPMDTSSVVISTVSSVTHRNVLGTIAGKDDLDVKIVPNLLTKQIDGYFDTNGILQYNPFLKKVIYTYYYRNQYVVATPSLVSDATGKTIDTVSIARIKVVYSNGDKIGKLASPPYIVNKGGSTYGKYLFINAAVTGRFEPIDMWKRASVIDAYNLIDQSYAFSFYLPDKSGKKISQFNVDDNRVIVICGKYLQVYQLQTDYYERIKL